MPITHPLKFQIIMSSGEVSISQSLYFNVTLQNLYIHRTMSVIVCGMKIILAPGKYVSFSHSFFISFELYSFVKQRRPVKQSQRGSLSYLLRVGDWHDSIKQSFAIQAILFILSRQGFQDIFKLESTLNPLLMFQNVA